MHTEISYHTFSILANLELAASLLAITVFIVIYALWSPWRKLLVGRTLMYLAMSMFLVLAHNSISVWFGIAYPGRNWVRLFLYFFLTAMLWRLVYTLLKVQNARIESVNSETLSWDKYDSEVQGS